MLPSGCFNWKGFTSAHLVEFKKELNSAVLKDMRSNKDNISVTVLAVDITRKESEYKFIIKWKKTKKQSLWRPAQMQMCIVIKVLNLVG